MVIEALILCFLAKIKHYKLKYLFSTWTFYPVLIAQCILIVFEFSVFFRTYYFVRFAPVMDFVIISSFLFCIFEFKLYKPAVFGSVSAVAGTILNKLAIAQNGGKMPAYPTLSFITGYLDPEIFGPADSIHALGDSATKLKILTDYIDFGYCVLSIGDVLIHMFFCIMLYSLIKAVNIRYSEQKKEETRAN